MSISSRPRPRSARTRSPYQRPGLRHVSLLAAAVCAGSALPAAGLLSGTAGATANPDCVTSGSTVTCTFNYNGSNNTNGTAMSWDVPAGLTDLTVVASGAAGADGSGVSSNPGDGGVGGQMKADLSGIAPYTTLRVFPGAKGARPNGGAGLASGGNGFSTIADTGGGGGGASAVSLSDLSCVVIHACTWNPLDYLLVLGGGGGGAAGHSTSNVLLANGGRGGREANPDGVDGAGAATTFGGGGTTSAGGAADTASPTGCTIAATAGTQLQGGNANSGACVDGGAGGGGGYFGGGGSAPNGGGGGGSAFPATTTTISGVTVTPVLDKKTNDANGRVIITYTMVPTYMATHAVRNFFLRRLTLYATLTTGSGPVSGEPVTFSTGSTDLCTATTDSSGHAVCQLTHDQSLEVNSHSGRYTATFTGDGALLSSSADGVGRIFRF